MKRIAFVTTVLAATLAWAGAAGGGEFGRYLAMAETLARRVWASIEAHPVPLVLAFGTFLLTVIYHRAKGLSLRESVEVAATRVTVVPVLQKEAAEVENPVVARAKARATRTQLIADQIVLQNRQRKLPDELLKAEKESCYSEQAVVDARRSLGEKHKAHNLAVARLQALRKENAQSEAELAEIAAELKKLEPRT